MQEGLSPQPLLFSSDTGTPVLVFGAGRQSGYRL